MNERHLQRQDSLFEHLPQNVDTAILAPGKSLYYLTGLSMHKSERPILVFLRRSDPPVLLLPRLETGSARAKLGSNVRIVAYDDSANPVDAARKALRELYSELAQKTPIAIDFRDTRLLEYQLLADSYPWEKVHDSGPAISQLRGKKDSSEVEKLRIAARITDRLLAECIEQIERGDSEADIEQDFRKRVLDSEADEFGVGIVTVGERTALPHTTTGTREVTSGDLVMIDAGVVLEGYYSDITRTFAVGEIDAELQTIYDTVRRAAHAAREAVAPGVPYQEIDRAARTIIEDAGYGEYFVHRVGHGLGLEGHEPPYLVEGNESTLSVGNVITVEPGIYVKGLGGVRIEDDVVLTDEGTETLTQTTRELVRL